MPVMQLSDGTELHFREQGNGSPVLLVHGFPLNGSMWNQQLESLAKQCRVLVPDLRGFGENRPAATEILTMGSFAADLDEFLTRLEITEPVHFCGLSMGGYIAFAFVKQFRSRVNSLILCDTKATDDSPEARQGRLETAERVLREGTEFLAAAMLEKLLSPFSIREQPALVAEVQNMIRSTPPQTIAAALRGMAARPDSSPQLESLDLPVLAVVGEDDSLTTPAQMHQMALSMPQTRVVEILKGGHLAPLEQPAAVNSAILEFLHAVDAG